MIQMYYIKQKHVSALELKQRERMCGWGECITTRNKTIYPSGSDVLDYRLANVKQKDELEPCDAPDYSITFKHCVSQIYCIYITLHHSISAVNYLPYRIAAEKSATFIPYWCPKCIHQFRYYYDSNASVI